MNQLWGRWLMVVAILHSAFGFYWFQESITTMWNSGLLASADSEKEKLAVWFLLSGGWMLMLGVIVMQLQSVPKTVTIVLLIMVLAGLLVMPRSGFWLLIPPAVGLAWSSLKSRRSA